MPIQKIVLVLTVLLVVVGVGAFVVNRMGGAERTYVDLKSFDVARGNGELPADAPALPGCAHAIAIVVVDNATSEVSFSCPDKAARDAYVAQVKNGFLWNILFFDPDRVKLVRASTE